MFGRFWFKGMVAAVCLFFLAACVPRVDGKGQTFFQATLTGDAAVPPNGSAGRGVASAVFLSSSSQLVITGSYQNLSSDVATAILGGAHIHAGSPGEHGPILAPLSIDGGSAGTFSGTFLLLPEQIRDLMAGRIFTLIHTAEHPHGELRGQLEARDKTEEQTIPTLDDRA